MTSHRALRSTAFVGLAGLLACGGAGGNPDPVSPETVATVVVTPATASVVIAGTTQLVATPRSASGNTLSRTVTWSSGNTTLATVNGSGTVTGVAVGIVTITATSGSAQGMATVTVTVPPVATVTVTPATPTIQVGQTSQLTAVTADAAGSPLTGRAVTWTTSNAAVVTVSTTGLVTAVATGTATITATSEGRSGTATVTVIPIPVASVTVTPATASVEIGRTSQLSASTTDAAGQPLTGRTIAWTTSNAAVATVTGTGLVTGVAVGTATITATSEGKTGTAAITVTVVPVASVAVTPATASVVVGQTTTLSATPQDAAGNALTGRTVTWSTSASAIATVSSSGVVTGVAAGTVTITATSEGKSGTVTVTVTPVPVASVSVAPATVSVPAGQSTQFTATAKDANDNVLTGRSITWTTSSAAVATVSTTGLVTGVAPGTATITATSEGKSGAATVTVTATVAATVAIKPSTASVVAGGTVALEASVSDAAGNVLTGRTVTWSSSSTGIATVSSSGVVTGVAVGTATITATSDGKSGTATITVLASAPATVSIKPTSANVYRGQTVTLTAAVTDAGGAAIAGAPIIWSSSNTAVATVSSAGIVSGVAVGTATITATSDTKSGSATVTVREPATSSCTLTNATLSLTIGQTTNGSLASTDCTFPDGSYADLYRLTLATGQTLQIDLTSTAFDAYLVLLDAQGSAVSANDDAGGGTNARITRTLAAGTYYVAANSLFSSAVGAYQLLVSTTTAPSACALSGATTIAVGQTTSGTLATTDCTLSDGSFADVYRVTIASGQTLQMDMASTAFDAYLILYDASGNAITSNDDGAGGTNARITRALTAGTYYLAANSLYYGRTGAYTVSVSLLTSSPCAITTATTNIAIGGTVSGALATTDCTLGDGSYADIYRLTVATGQTLRVDLSSAAFDTYLIAYDASGNVLASDDDGSGGTNSRLTREFSAGTYYLAANSYLPGRTGAYSLSVAVAQSACVITGTTTAITIGPTVTGALASTDCVMSDGSYADVYRLTVATGQTLQIDLASTAFDAYLGLYDSNGSLITSNDDGGGGTNARISRSFSAGTYYILANSLFSGRTGAYTLSVVVPTVSAVCTTANATTITLGQTIAGSLGTTDCTLSQSYADIYRLTLTTAQSIRIDLTSGAFDTFLVLYDANGTLITTDDDGGLITDSRIDRSLAAGTYYIASTSYSAGRTGAYQLSVAAVSTSTCTTSSATATAVGQTVNGAISTTDCSLSDGSYADMYRFTLAAGQSVQIDLTSSAFDAFLILYDANGTLITSNDDVGSGTNSRIVQTLTAGTYYIAATTLYPGRTGAYQLSITTATASTACTTAGATAIAVGQTVTGSLLTTDCTLSDGSYADVYRLTIATGQTVVVDMSSTAFDTYLWLTDANGVIVTGDDDSGGGTNSRITRTLTAGTYYLLANSLLSGVTGSYQLQVH